MVVASTGFFDGVHLGHRVVLERLLSFSKEHRMRSVVISFWPHPRIVLQQDADRLRLLTTLEEKRRLIIKSGVDDFIIIPFTQELSRLTAEEFMTKYLRDQYGVSALILGYDHRMGRDDNSQQDIVRIANQSGLEAMIVAEELSNGTKISSTTIRNLLSEGDVSKANTLLGYDYQLNGVVVLGSQIGRTIGFPTANMQLYEPLKIVPALGVYAVEVTINGDRYKGMTNIGIRPTIGDNNNVSIETHILDFDEYIYGMEYTIAFKERIRPEKKFDSVEKLKEQLSKDRRYVEDSL